MMPACRGFWCTEWAESPVKPTVTLAQATAPDGAVFRLARHDGEFSLFMNDRRVMSTTLTHSELLLADGGCDFRDKRRHPRVLIGGLGLGFSLRRSLEITGEKAVIEVAELLPEIIQWNRGCLDGYNDDILADPRTRVVDADVYDLILMAADGKAARYDAILLDVDDGPSSLLQPRNARIYDQRGLQVIKRALSPGGRVAFWSAGVEAGLLRDLRRSGFAVEEVSAAKHPRAKRKQHRIYLAERRD